uniref:T-complex protein 1 subunit delta n=1 Tax=Caenorhabditis tropicalis TaxID=1561998 RepID=A0A1I7UQI3_9PELO
MESEDGASIATGTDCGTNAYGERRSNQTPVIGFHVTLITKSEDRCEGTLHAIDPYDKTIGLSNVWFYGAQEANKTASKNVTYQDFAIFHFDDIKNVSLCDKPKAQAEAPPSNINGAELLKSEQSFPKENKIFGEKLSLKRSTEQLILMSRTLRTTLGSQGRSKLIRTTSGAAYTSSSALEILRAVPKTDPILDMMTVRAERQVTECGDGATTVVILTGALLDAAQNLLSKRIHPTTISESFQSAAAKAEKILEEMSFPVDLSNDALLNKMATISLNSKVVSQHSWILAPMAVNAVKKIINSENDSNVNLKMIKIIKKMGDTVEESELIEGALIDQKTMGCGAPTRIEKAKIDLIQFQISPPKTDMENQVIITDYAQMDRALKEECQYLLEICKKIKAAGCNVLLIQKSIPRDAVNELAFHFLAKMEIMCIKDIEREDIEFYSKILGCRPVASVDHFNAEALGYADLVEEIPTGGDGKVIKVTGVQNPGHAVSILLCASDEYDLDSRTRCFKNLTKTLAGVFEKKALLPGGGAPEMEISVKLRSLAQTHEAKHHSWRAFADVLELVPYTLAENAGLSPIHTVTELRNSHTNGNSSYGVNVRKGYVTDMVEENVVQPLLVTASAINHASECAQFILKLDETIRF